MDFGYGWVWKPIRYPFAHNEETAEYTSLKVREEVCARYTNLEGKGL
jgi:hypothetical protein